jgi:hypothetical protein
VVKEVEEGEEIRKRAWSVGRKSRLPYWGLFVANAVNTRQEHTLLIERSGLILFRGT